MKLTPAVEGKGGALGLDPIGPQSVVRDRGAGCATPPGQFDYRG